MILFFLSIIGVDSGGYVGSPPVIMAAVRRGRRRGRDRLQRDRREHYILRLSGEKENEYFKYLHKRKHQKNWNLKISAALIFTAIQEIIKLDDVIHIDVDFSNDSYRKIVRDYLLKIFGEVYEGKNPLSCPCIAYHTKDKSAMVKKAHDKHGWARKKIYRDVRSRSCPSLYKYLQIIEEL